MVSPMRRLIQILLVTLTLTSASAMAQTATCGIIDIEGPSQADPDKPLAFKVKTTGIVHTTNPEFKWKLSAGAIMTGQGTSEITVDTAGLGGQEVNVVVELAGAPPGCKGVASKTVQLKLPSPTGCAFDSYGDIKFNDEMARLDNFAIQLMNQPLSSGHILMFAGQVTFERETEERLSRAKSHLVETREVDPNRIVTVDCGFSTEMTVQLWVVPLGANLPACSPEIEVPFPVVKFTKPRSKSSKKLR